LENKKAIIEITQKYLDDVTYEVIGAAIEVQKQMGRGLLESVYHQCMIEEMRYRKINFLTELKILYFISKKNYNWILDVTCLWKIA